MDEEGEECVAKVPVSWDTIKRIWVAAVEHFDLTPQVTSTECTCAALGKHNIPHARNCPAVSSTLRATPSEDK
jgi:hypothetical protein